LSWSRFGGGTLIGQPGSCAFAGSLTRGELGAPKSRRSSRAVPLADRVAAELDRHFQRSASQADDDLVFAHPQTGSPYDASRLRKRFKGAIVRAGIRDVRFHDLRQTFGTRMAASGAPLRALMEWMGHRDLATHACVRGLRAGPGAGSFVCEVSLRDWFQFRGRAREELTPEDVSQYVAVKEIVDSHGEAEREAARHNQLQAEREVEAFYFVHPTRHVTYDTDA